MDRSSQMDNSSPNINWQWIICLWYKNTNFVIITISFAVPYWLVCQPTRLCGISDTLWIFKVCFYYRILFKMFIVCTVAKCCWMQDKILPNLIESMSNIMCFKRPLINNYFRIIILHVGWPFLLRLNNTSFAFDTFFQLWFLYPSCKWIITYRKSWPGRGTLTFVWNF